MTGIQSVVIPLLVVGQPVANGNITPGATLASIGTNSATLATGYPATASGAVNVATSNAIAISNAATGSASVTLTASDYLATVPLVTGAALSYDTGMIGSPVSTIPNNNLEPYWSVASSGCSTAPAIISFSLLMKPTGAQ